MAGLWAARTAPDMRVVLLDGARKLGAKILVSGGGRCNVTHEIVRAEDFNGSSRPAIRKVLSRFDVPRTIELFADLGVALKREETGKLFPVTDDARTVLRALTEAVSGAGAIVRHPRRVRAVRRENGRLHIGGEWGAIEASRVILASGGKSLPKTGSDGSGYGIARGLGHEPTKHLFPALVPLMLPRGHVLCSLAGVSAPVTLTVRTTSRKPIAACAGSLLCTHFGLSGPAVLDVSRHWHAARLTDGTGIELVCDWLPAATAEALDSALRVPGRGTVLGRLRGSVPERLARMLCAESAVDHDTQASRLARDDRKRLVLALKEMDLPVTGDRGWTHAEVTAGGIPLAQLDLATMESRVCPGLHLCGEICDVDGRIGGFNFQWAWASGYVAGTGAARTITAARASAHRTGEPA